MSASAPSRPAPGRGWIVALRIFMAAVVVLAVTVFVTLRRLARDEPPPQDSDLRVTLAVIPDEQNGFVQIQKLPSAPLDFIGFAATREVDEQAALAILNGRARNDVVVDAFLLQAQPVLTQLDDILALPRFEPTGEINDSTVLGYIAPTLGMARTLRLTAQRRLQAGDFAGALQELRRLRRLATRLSEGHCPLVQFLTAVTVEIHGLELATQMLNAPALPRTVRSGLAESYAGNVDWFAAFARAVRLEYCWVAWRLGELHRRGDFSMLQNGSQPPGKVKRWMGRKIAPLVLQRNATLRILAEYHHIVLGHLGEPFDRYHATVDAASKQLVPRTTGDWIGPNPLGKSLMAIMLPAYFGTDTVSYAATARDRIVQTGLALRAYFDDHGQLPADLAALVPQYLAAVPADPFDGQPLRYDAAKGLVYSVGTDLADHGGSKFVAMAPDQEDYENPLSDPAQPTLVLTFQHKTAANTPAAEAPPTSPPPPAW